MNSPLIHIGYPKSGTTWFQKNFYPYVRNARFIPRKEIQDHIIKPYALDFDPDSAIQYFHPGDGSRILICEELLLASVRSGGFNGFVIKEIGHRLKSTFPEGKIIIFVRNQIDLIASAYGQYIKDGGRSGIDQYLYHTNAKFYVNFSRFSFQYLEYDRVLDFYRKLFGDNVFVFTFEKFVRNKTGFLDDFCKTFNLEIDIDKLDFSEKNRRLNTPSYLKWRNRLRIPRKVSISRITGGALTHETVFRNRNSAQKILGKKNTQYIKQYYRKSNQRLIDVYGMDEVHELGYPLDSV